MEPTREQLQEEILEILYQKSINRPTWITCSEIYWNIKNLKVSERSVKEILDWLVKNDLVLHQADKYQIDKREFLDMSLRKSSDDVEGAGLSDMQGTDTFDTPYHFSNLWERGVRIYRHSNTAFAIIALIALLLSGTFIGILVFNCFTPQTSIPVELVALKDSTVMEPAKVFEPTFIKDAYGINRNFKALQTTLISQHDVNEVVSAKLNAQQNSINKLTEALQQQNDHNYALEKERNIYTWITASVLLVLSLLLVCLFGRRR